MEHAVRRPKTQRGKRFVERRQPQINEFDKETLIVKGRKTSQTVIDFLNDISTIKKPFVTKLKFKNPVLPFEDASFIEKMCSKNECGLFVLGLHSKKRPNNIVLGRVFDGEILDMFEFGIKNYTPISGQNKIHASHGSKPMLVFSGEGFNEDSELANLKSLLIDMFRGPKVEKIRSSGIEYQIHFTMSSASVLSVRTRIIKLISAKNADSDTPKLRTPWGKVVQVELEDVQPSFDLIVRRKKNPSVEKWRDSMRVPTQVLQQEREGNRQKHKKYGVDDFGSRVGQVHVSRENAVDTLRPGAELRTALTGKRKRGNDQVEKPGSLKKRRAGGKFSEQALESCNDGGSFQSGPMPMDSGDPLSGFKASKLHSNS